MPGFVYSVSYERLLADPLSETRKLLDYCALAWEDACANVQQKPSPMSSASASEVRQGMSDSSVSQWRHYETQLAPLGNQLHAAGVAPE
jgi:hypothetical protein